MVKNAVLWRGQMTGLETFESTLTRNHGSSSSGLTLQQVVRVAWLLRSPWPANLVKAPGACYLSSVPSPLSLFFSILSQLGIVLKSHSFCLLVTRKKKFSINYTNNQFASSVYWCFKWQHKPSNNWHPLEITRLYSSAISLFMGWLTAN